MQFSILRRKLNTALTDLRHGALLNGKIKSQHPDAFNTENSGYDVLDRIFAGRVRPDDILVDIGCGKGRVLNWWSDNYPAQMAYGIEINHNVAEETRHRFKRRRFIEIRTGDAIEDNLIPPSATLFYLFNPFGEKKMRELADKIAGDGMPRRIIYYNCTCLSVFENDKRFKVTPIAIEGHHASAVMDLIPSP